MLVGFSQRGVLGLLGDELHLVSDVARRAGIRQFVTVASGALEEPRSHQAQRLTAREKELRLPARETFSFIDELINPVLTEITRQALGLLGGLIGIVRYRILALLAELLAGLVCRVNDGLQAVDRPLLLNFKQCRSPSTGMVEHLAGFFLSLIDDRRRSRGHLVDSLHALRSLAAGTLSCALVLRGASPVPIVPPSFLPVHPATAR